MDMAGHIGSSSGPSVRSREELLLRFNTTSLRLQSPVSVEVPPEPPTVTEACQTHRSLRSHDPSPSTSRHTRTTSLNGQPDHVEVASPSSASEAASGNHRSRKRARPNSSLADTSDEAMGNRSGRFTRSRRSDRHVSQAESKHDDNDECDGVESDESVSPVRNTRQSHRQSRSSRESNRQSSRVSTRQSSRRAGRGQVPVDYADKDGSSSEHDSDNGNMELSDDQRSVGGGEEEGLESDDKRKVVKNEASSVTTSTSRRSNKISSALKEQMLAVLEAAIANDNMEVPDLLPMAYIM